MVGVGGDLGGGCNRKAALIFCLLNESFLMQSHSQVSTKPLKYSTTTLSRLSHPFPFLLACLGAKA